jgi:general secretion pathway protein H
MPCRSRLSSLGFTLLELLVVIAIVALATAGVAMAIPDSSRAQLDREAERLAVLFETARAQSRASGVPAYWRATEDGFRFDGLPLAALPTQWLSPNTQAEGARFVQLGPEPIIGPQEVLLSSTAPPAVSGAGAGTAQVRRQLRISTDGLRPFAVQDVNAP